MDPVGRWLERALHEQMSSPGSSDTEEAACSLKLLLREELLREELKQFEDEANGKDKGNAAACSLRCSQLKDTANDKGKTNEAACSLRCSQLKDKANDKDKAIDKDKANRSEAACSQENTPRKGKIRRLGHIEAACSQVIIVSDSPIDDAKDDACAETQLPIDDANDDICLETQLEIQSACDEIQLDASDFDIE